MDIIASFLMESGVKMLLGDLETALKRGDRIRILTGNYLGITQPSALFLIKRRLGNQVDLGFYNEKDLSFHPKSFFLQEQTEKTWNPALHMKSTVLFQTRIM